MGSIPNRRFVAASLIAGLAMGLAACDSSRLNFPGSGRSSDTDIAPADGIVPGGGEGATKVALLLPLSTTGKFGRVAKSMKNAAELALFETGEKAVLLIPKDTGGTPGGARKAASEAISEGAELILGPVFAGSVTAAGAVARSANVPVIGFSTTTSVAGNGIYLLSMTPQEEVDRIVDYAIKRGKKRFGALIPQGGYGNVVSGALKRSVEQRGGRVVAVERYAQSSAGITGPTASIARLASGSNPKIDTLLIAEGDPLLRSIAPLLSSSGMNKSRVKLIGTGLWANPAIASEPALRGGWFPSGPPGARRSYEQRYREVYGAPPVAISSLAYDGVKLAGRLASAAPQGERYSRRSLEDETGFSGINGMFRFRQDGTPERGMSILEVTSSGFRVIDSGNNRFGSGASF